MSRPLVAIAAVFLTVAVFPASATCRSAQIALPEAGPFLENVRKHLKSDRALLGQYTFTERELERRLNGKGVVTKEDLRLNEVYPPLEQDDEPYRRTISVNGEPVARGVLEKKDDERRKKVLAYSERLQHESESDRRKRLAKEAERDRKEQETIDEILRVYDVRLLSRDMIGGRPAILCSVTPRPDYRPRTDDGKILKKFGGRVWFDEDDYELVRADVQVTDDLTFGFGIFARLHKGSRFEIVRRKVNDEIWLPAEVRYQVSARIALLKRIRAEGVSTYSDYKKFSVQTSTTFSVPKKP
jgi:hypothetical protein